MLDSPGPLLIDARLPATAEEPAVAVREEDGWRSVYVGGAPLPADVLRRFMREAGVAPWSDRPDVVKGVEDAVSLVATSTGRRTLTLPKPMADARGGPAARMHTLDLEFGDVRLFTA